MVVLLPGIIDGDDVTAHLQTTLVEAFCWEYNIRSLKINNTQDIARMLAQCSDTTDGKTMKELGANTDYNCILIEVRIWDDIM